MEGNFYRDLLAMLLFVTNHRWISVKVCLIKNQKKAPTQPGGGLTEKEFLVV
jgi:hypothetical protein